MYVIDPGASAKRVRQYERAMALLLQNFYRKLAHETSRVPDVVHGVLYYVRRQVRPGEEAVICVVGREENADTATEMLTDSCDNRWR